MQKPAHQHLLLVLIQITAHLCNGYYKKNDCGGKIFTLGNVLKSVNYIQWYNAFVHHIYYAEVTRPSELANWQLVPVCISKLVPHSLTSRAFQFHGLTCHGVLRGSEQWLYQDVS